MKGNGRNAALAWGEAENRNLAPASAKSAKSNRAGEVAVKSQVAGTDRLALGRSRALSASEGKATQARDVAGNTMLPRYECPSTPECQRGSNGVLAEFFSRVVETDLSDYESWFRECLGIAEAQYGKSGHSLEEGAFDVSGKGWLISLTAFQAAKWLLPPHDFRQMEVATKILACTQRYLLHSDRQMEEVEVQCLDCTSLAAYFLPSRHARKLATTVICICDDRDALLGQVLPATVEKDIALLIVEVSDLRVCSVGNLARYKMTSEMRFISCVDYLLARQDVDAKCVAVYGQGFAAESATNFAICDPRIAAAVCDGGLWDAARTRGAVEWITGREQDLSGKDARRSRLARKMKCPFLVVADEQGVGSILEAGALHAECREVGVGMDLHIPQANRTIRGAIEGLLNTHELAFDWILSKLGE